MKPLDLSLATKSATNRRSFLRNAGGATAAVAALGLAPQALLASAPAVTSAVDTPDEIFTAALIAEDLATTFYYNVLIGEVMQNVNLAGPGGSATSVSSTGSVSNVGYIQGALSEEVSHANLFRSLIGGKNQYSDPYKTFYIKANAFSDFNEFVGQLMTFETVFIGAYMAAIQQFALLAAEGKALTFNGMTYQPSDFAYYAKISASILGVEAEHRALGRAISPTLIPANNLNYEQTAGLTAVYNGPNSAVAALTPYLTPGGDREAYSFITAVTNHPKVSLPTSGSIPAE